MYFVFLFSFHGALAHLSTVRFRMNLKVKITAPVEALSISSLVRGTATGFMKSNKLCNLTEI